MQLGVLNVLGLYSDVVLKAYLRRKFCHASDNFIYCNSFHCDNCRGGLNTLQEEIQVHPSTETIYHHKKEVLPFKLDTEEIGKFV